MHLRPLTGAWIREIATSKSPSERSLVRALLILLPLAVGAPPNPRERGLYVADEAGLIPEYVKADLHVAAKDLQARGGGAVSMITLPSAAPGEAERLRRAWGLPAQDKVLLVVEAPRRGELAAGPPGESGLDGAARAELEARVLGPALADGGDVGEALMATLVALGAPELRPQGDPRAARRGALVGVLVALGLAGLATRRRDFDHGHGGR